MAIYRPQEPTRDYSKSARTWARDPRLSAKAKGILTNISSHAPTYELTFEQIVAEMKDDERAIRSGIKELEASGYLNRWRRRNEDGTLGGYDWQVIDYPDVFAGRDQDAKTQSGSEQGKHGKTAGGDHTAKAHPGSDQEKHGVSAGQDHTAKPQGGDEQGKDGVFAGGNHTAKRRTKKTKEHQVENKENINSLSGAELPSPPAPRQPGAEDRERDEVTSSSTPQLQDPRHAMVIRHGAPEHLAEQIIEAIEAANPNIRTLGWWTDLDSKGHLAWHVQKALAVLNSPDDQQQAEIRCPVHNQYWSHSCIACFDAVRRDEDPFDHCPQRRPVGWYDIYDRQPGRDLQPRSSNPNRRQPGHTSQSSEGRNAEGWHAIGDQIRAAMAANNHQQP